MAASQAMLGRLLGRCVTLVPRQNGLVAPAAIEGQRFLTTNPKYLKPFPYKTKQFTLRHALTEYTVKRLNENSRIIMIEGAPCVGKTEFAKSLADTFQLQYLPAVTEDTLFNINGFDLRSLNEMMPLDKMKFWDLDSFYAEKNPEDNPHYVSTQIRFFTDRYFQYVEALNHVLHTGQGVVLETNVFSDICYALNMAEFGFFPRKALKWFMGYREKTLSWLMKPHLVIHLDAPSSYIVKKMKEKNPQLQDSPVLTEKYIDGLVDKLKNIHLRGMRKHSDILSYDVTNMEDYDLLTMDLEKMDLISSKFGESVKFADWHKAKEEHWSLYRLGASSRQWAIANISWQGPYDIPWLWLNGEEEEFLYSLRAKIPQLKYCGQYWQDSDGNLLSRPEAGDMTPLSNLRDHPEYMERLGIKGHEQLGS